MRQINHIVLHCTATAQSTTVESILNYWKNIKKWKSPGYHYLIEADGTVNKIHPIESVSNGVRGYNSDSIHISYIGGVAEDLTPTDNRTAMQVLAQLDILIKLKERFPYAKICGHRDFEGVNKACPSFDVKEFIKQVKLI